MVQYLGNQRGVVRFQQQIPLLLDQLDAPIAADILAHFGHNIARDGVLAIACKLVQDLLRIHAARCRIPEGERGEAIGVDMFWRFLQLGKLRQRITGLRMLWMIYFEQNSTITLHDNRVARIHVFYTPGISAHALTYFIMASVAAASYPRIK